MIASCIEDTGSTKDRIKYLTIIKAKFDLSSKILHRPSSYLFAEWGLVPRWQKSGFTCTESPGWNYPDDGITWTIRPSGRNQKKNSRPTQMELPTRNFPTRTIVYIWRGSVDILNTQIVGQLVAAQSVT